MAGAHLLHEQLTAPVDERPAIAARMRDTEHAGDDATHGMFTSVDSTFVTPFDRQDIYSDIPRLRGSAVHGLVVVLAALLGAIAWNLLTWNRSAPYELVPGRRPVRT